MSAWLRPRKDEHTCAMTMDALSLLVSGMELQEISAQQGTRLEEHLAACEACAEASRGMHEIANQLRSRAGGINAGSYLVRTTQLRVRQRAMQMRERQERMSPLWISCAIASLWALISVPLLWEGFSWLGGRGMVADLVWQSGFVVAWLMPFGLVAALLLWTLGEKAIQH